MDGMTSADAASRRFWDRNAAKYARDPIRDRAGYQRTLDRTAALLTADDAVLELGCGTGTTALHLAPRTRRYLATDLSPAMIAIARDKLAASPCPPLDFRQATAETLADGGERFDAVLAFNLLHLVPDLATTLRQIRQLIRPGGLFVSKTPCLGEMSVLIRLLLPPLRLLGKAPDVAILTAEALERAVVAAGFDMLASERHGSGAKDPRPVLIARRPVEESADLPGQGVAD